jgi:hypothetical protein
MLNVSDDILLMQTRRAQALLGDIDNILSNGDVTTKGYPRLDFKFLQLQAAIDCFCNHAFDYDPRLDSVN